MELKQCDFSDLSKAKYTFSICSLPYFPNSRCLVVAFSGIAANSREYFGTFAFMRAILAAGLAGWVPKAVVVDLRELEYAWGDGMISVVDAAQNYYLYAF